MRKLIPCRGLDFVAAGGALWQRALTSMPKALGSILKTANEHPKKPNKPTPLPVLQPSSSCVRAYLLHPLPCLYTFSEPAHQDTHSRALVSLMAHQGTNPWCWLLLILAHLLVINVLFKNWEWEWQKPLALWRGG
jgi:hypothetical protein